MQKLTDVYTYDPCHIPTEPCWSRFFGAQIWYKNEVVHRDGDQPAIVQADGTLTYVENGDVHRDGDLPAIIKPNGTQMWFVRGKRHRAEGRPALITATKIEYYENGLLHREGGPATVLIGSDYRMYEYRRHDIVHRDERDEHGLLLPAVYTEPEGVFINKYYLHGIEVNRDGTPYKN
jgi:hypothetical protein